MDVRDVGVALWRQRPLVALVLLVTGAAVAAGLLLAPKAYDATATLTAAPAAGTESGAADLDPLRATLARLAASGPVVDAARDGLDPAVRATRSVDQLRAETSGEWVRGTLLVQVTVRDRDPDVAAAVANSVVGVLAEGTVTGEQTAGATDGVFVMAVSDEARPPQSFASPDLPLAIGVGVLVALALAAAAAVLRDRRTHTVNDATAVEEAAGAPLLAHLVAPRDPTAMPALTPGTAEAELFRHLRVTLAGEADHGARRVVVAGIASGDAEVWIGANVAIALATAGRRVLLVDGRMGARFGTPREQAPDTPGLYDVLLGADLDAALSAGPVDRLRVLPPGTWGDEPVPELLAQRFGPVMDQAAADFDNVVVLGPPLEVAEDSRVMAVDSTLVLALVEGAVSATALHAHAERVRAVGARLLGLVLVARPAQT